MEDRNSRDPTPDLYGGDAIGLTRDPTVRPSSLSSSRTPSVAHTHNAEPGSGVCISQTLDSHILITGSKHVPTEGKATVSDSELASLESYHGQSKRKRDSGNAGTPAQSPYRVHGSDGEPKSKRLRGTGDLVLESLSAKSGEEQLLYGLTVSLWQRILTFVPPAILARLLRVSRSFNAMLVAPRRLKSSHESKVFHSQTCLQPNSIWLQSRKLFARGLPEPMEGQCELDVWKLIKGNRCQNCGQRKTLSTSSVAQDAWQAGPGAQSVRVIWAFAVRLCGECLRSQTRKDDDLTFSGSFPAFLKDGLAHVFLTEHNDYISASKLRTGKPLPELVLTKVYYMPHIENIKRRYDHAKEFGQGSAEKWVQSLDLDRQKRDSDAMAWDIWEQTGALARLNAGPGPRKSLISRTGKNVSALPTVKIPKQSGDATSSTSTIPTLSHGPPIGRSDRSLISTSATLPQRPHNSTIPASEKQPQTSRPPSEFEPMKIARRAEIERRSAALSSPMSPELLTYMDSFWAALQISSTLDDSSWVFLRERLEAERAEAEVRLLQAREGHETHKPAGLHKVNDFRQVQDHPRTRKSLPILPDACEQEKADSTQKEEVKVSEDEAQGPTAKLATVLGQFADEIIQKKWNEARSLSKESCSQFAADVLIHVRSSFYEGIRKGAYSDDPSMPTRLSLENMKSLFESKVKRLTEQHQKEIFLCNGCENNAKAYGFEAVIQHYAAKHTHILSLGSVVVHWKAEWPEKPPFHPNPMLVKALAITASTSTNPPGQLHSRGSHHEQHQLSNGQRFSFSAQQSQSPTVQHGYQSPPSNTTLRAAIQSGPSHTEQFVNPTQLPPNLVNHGYFASGTFAPPQPPLPLHPPPANVGFPDPGYGSPYQPPTAFGMQGTQIAAQAGMPTAETYRTHLGEMAKLARELWFATAGVKGLPGTVRIQIIIHHACERFVSRFNLQPGVAMFLDGLNLESAMRPLRSLNGFACKACAEGQAGALPFDERKQSTLPHLLGHFKAVHAEYHGLDWRKDMVQLPGLGAISELVNSPGIDDAKLALLAAAFPKAFSFPLPSVSSLQQKALNKYDSDAYRGGNKVPPGAYRDDLSLESPSKAVGYSGIIMPVEAPLTDVAADDEYDPRRPSYIGRIVENHTGGLNQPPRHDERMSFAANDAISRLSPPGSRLEIGDADRFLEDLKPHIHAPQAGERRGASFGELLPNRTQGARLYDSDHAYGGSTTKIIGPVPMEQRYYSRSEMRLTDPSDIRVDRYFTARHETDRTRDVGRMGHAAREIAYYIRQPDGRLIPTDDRGIPVLYERSNTGGELKAEHMDENRGGMRLSTQQPSISYYERPGTYEHRAIGPAADYDMPGTRVVYLDRQRTPPSSAKLYSPPYGQQQEDVYQHNRNYGDGVRHR